MTLHFFSTLCAETLFPPLYFEPKPNLSKTLKGLLMRLVIFENTIFQLNSLNHSTRLSCPVWGLKRAWEVCVVCMITGITKAPPTNYLRQNIVFSYPEIIRVSFSSFLSLSIKSIKKLIKKQKLSKNNNSN